VPCGNSDDPPNTSTKPLVAGAIEDARFMTAKLAGLTGAICGRSSTACSVTHTGDESGVRKTLKLLPMAPAKAFRSRRSSAPAWSCQLFD